jgi:C_GCAxxG_C_C family probable redox protein
MAAAGESVPDLAYRLAYENESTYGGCSQSVIKALMDVFDLDLKDVLKASQPLAGGLSVYARGSCGALAGGMLVMGYVYGRSVEELPKGPKAKTYLITRRLLEEFEAEFGSVSCPDIQRKLMGRSFDLLKEEDWNEFLEKGGHRDKCPHVCGTVAKLTARILVERGVPLRKAAGNS